MPLEKVFMELVSPYTDDPGIVRPLWTEIERAYSEKGRRYHTLEHLRQMLRELNGLGDRLGRRNGVLFALFYHDVIYRVQRSDNEKRSAELAVDRMERLGVAMEDVQFSRTCILATQGHEQLEEPDVNFFTDADLCILGKPWPDYQRYAEGIRAEYSIYPDLLYRSGRKKVLAHFLEMRHIYKTDHFRALYEEQARSNLAKEMAAL